MDEHGRLKKKRSPLSIAIRGRCNLEDWRSYHDFGKQKSLINSPLYHHWIGFKGKSYLETIDFLRKNCFFFSGSTFFPQTNPARPILVRCIPHSWRKKITNFVHESYPLIKRSNITIENHRFWWEKSSERSTWPYFHQGVDTKFHLTANPWSNHEKSSFKMWLNMWLNMVKSQY